MTKAYGDWVVRWRYAVLLVTVLLVAVAASGGRFLTFKTDYRVFFSEDNPQLLAFEELQNTYTKTDNVLIVLAPKDGNVFTRETLASVATLTKAAWQLPYSLRVDSLTNYQHTRAVGDDLIVADLVPDPSRLGPEELHAIREIAVNEPLLVSRLVSAQGHVTGVNITIQLPDNGSGKEVPAITGHARELVEQVKAENPKLDVYLTGMVIMNNSFPEVSVRDQQTLIPIMFMIVLVTLAFLLRSLSSMIGTFIVIVFSILTAMGLAGWLGMGLTPPSASSPPIILTLAVADCVHFLVTFLHAMRKGMDRHSAIVESLRINMQPIFLTSLTTVIGFMSMNFSDAPPFRDLGNIVAMGVAAAFVFSVTFLPALMAILPVRVKAGTARHTGRIDRFADFVVARQTGLFWISGVVIILLVAFIPRNELNDEFVKYFDDSIPFRTATEFASENLTGIYTIDYSLGNGEVGGISEPAFLADVERFAEWYEAQPGVLHVNTLTDIMRRLNKNMHADDETWYRLPDERELSAQYLLLYEMSLPYGLDLNNQINIDKSATRMTVTLDSVSSNQLLSIEASAQAWLADNAPYMKSGGASPSVMFAYIGQRNIRSMLIAASLALVLISIILIFALRSFKIGMVSLIPNLAPAGMGFGLWGLMYGQVGLGMSVVMGMTLGIVVDDTVHFLSKYLRARREQGLDAPDAVRYAFHTVGVALIVTTLVLIAGFMVLTQSAFKLNADMGLLTAITIGLALIADFIFLPPLLMKADKSAVRP
ncbi:MAG TPA: MMPL family transporter [Gammaproteobacteria bacterium]|jgi:predicted RND superfamily exporter protein|nr:MMPL family transporter [Gammaproteobacteria bacterium]